MMRRSVPIVVLAVVLIACGGDSGGDTGPATSTAVDDATSTIASTVPDQGPSLFGSFDQPIALLTPESGGGPRPLLEWTEVPGADHYAVYLYAPSGDPYWVWSGRSTSVHVGGEPQLADGVLGPAVSDGMSWIVIAHDADRVPLAVSAERPLSP